MDGKVALVSGANQGLGYALVAGLCAVETDINGFIYRTFPMRLRRTARAKNNRDAAGEAQRPAIAWFPKKFRRTCRL